jgi:hypothetical protein
MSHRAAVAANRLQMIISFFLRDAFSEQMKSCASYTRLLLGTAICRMSAPLMAAALNRLSWWLILLHRDRYIVYFIKCNGIFIVLSIV